MVLRIALKAAKAAVASPSGSDAFAFFDVLTTKWTDIAVPQF